MTKFLKTNRKYVVIGAVSITAIATATVLAGQFIADSTLRDFTSGKLVDADIWAAEPSILSAGFGFDSIIGLPQLTEDVVRQAGGSWYGDLKCTSGKEPDP